MNEQVREPWQGPFYGLAKGQEYLYILKRPYESEYQVQLWSCMDSLKRDFAELNSH